MNVEILKAYSAFFFHDITLVSHSISADFFVRYELFDCYFFIYVIFFFKVHLFSLNLLIIYYYYHTMYSSICPLSIYVSSPSFFISGI